MATEALLNFDELLAPVPGDDPSGSSIPFDIRQKLEEGRKEENPDDFAPDDPLRPAQARRAEWGTISRLCQDTLKNSSKDLMLAARLTEALTKLHGFAGLRDGFRLLRRMVEEAWDRIRPTIEDGDLEVRAAAFNWLDDADRGARFPTTVRSAPVVQGELGGYGWLAWRQSMDGKGPVPREEFEKAVAAASRESCQALADDLEATRQEVQLLLEQLNAKMGAVSPGLTGFRPAVEDCRTLVLQILERKGPAPVVAEEGAAETRGGDSPNSLAPRAATRDDIYRQLYQSAAALQQLEPHSPIPYLVFRAVELGALPFPQLIRALIRDMSVLTELNRELGIPEPPSE
jgi:type VI secretion system protein ImpA